LEEIFMNIRSLFAPFLAIGLGVLTGCYMQPDLSGSYTTSVNATTSSGEHWRGTADVLLTQTGSALAGNITLHHPSAGTIQIPITSGSAADGKVLFFGHAQLPMGTVDVSFHGELKSSQIEGAAEMSIHSLLGSETDNANLLLAKAS
jgi:hypothetical protein